MARRYVMQYSKIPNFFQQSGYVEIKRTLHPRWYVAARLGYLRASAYQAPNTYEMAVGYRPNSHQLVKLEYENPAEPGDPRDAAECAGGPGGHDADAVDLRG
jgi:hypothetical protein